MKKIIILLLIAFASLSSYAQDPQLFENDWYLQKVVIDGQDIFPTSNDEVDSIIFDIDISGFFTSVCETIGADIIEYDSNTFTINEYVAFGDTCNINENQIFQQLYFNDFFKFPMQNLNFTYILENQGNGYITLTLINDLGNQAIYGNELLSNQDFDILSFEIYPNPVKDELFIASKTSINDFNIFIYSIDGKLILSINDSELSNNSIDVQKLNRGIYFIRFEDNLGRNAIKKFIKN